jgi:hypothetical protein
MLRYQIAPLVEDRIDYFFDGHLESMFTAPSIYDNYTPVAFVVAMLVIKLY